MSPPSRRCDMVTINSAPSQASPAQPSPASQAPATKAEKKRTGDSAPDVEAAADDLSLASLTPLSLSLSPVGGLSVTLHEQHIGTLLGSIVWPGGRYLALYLHHMHTALPTLLPFDPSRPAPPNRVCAHFSLPHSFLRGKRVIELGSGTGIVGIIAARCSPSTLVLTDLPALLPLLAANVASNIPSTSVSTAIHCLPLTWSTTLTAAELTGELAVPFDVMLLSDVVYDAFDTRQADGINNHQRLFHTLHCFAQLSPSLLVLLTYTARREEESVFFELLRLHGYCWSAKRADDVVPNGVDAEDRRVDFYVIWRNECVSGDMHRHVRDRRLSAWVTAERSKQNEELQRKLLQRMTQRQRAATSKQGR